MNIVEIWLIVMLLFMMLVVDIIANSDVLDFFDDSDIGE